MRAPGLVKCPTCKKSGQWFDGAYGPFCSRRCKLIDLGKWFEEEHAISEPIQPEDMVQSQSSGAGASNTSEEGEGD